LKLASMKSSSRDGELLVVSRDLKRAVSAKTIAPNLRTAVETWSQCKTDLELISKRLNSSQMEASFELNMSSLMSALPRAFQFADGSAFLEHVRLVRRARGAELPEKLLTVPLMYQGVGDRFLDPTEDIPFQDPTFGLDFESEICVITSDIARGSDAKKCEESILLFVLMNDISLRGLIPEELSHGFGFFQSKPPSALSPIAVTPDELDGHWRDGKVHLPLLTDYNGDFFGNPDAGSMHFRFGDLLAHAARTRDLQAGVVLGSGTVSNEDRSRGSSCLAEKRMIEQIESGKPVTPFMKSGDTVEIKMLLPNGENIFGTIRQKVR